MSYHTRAVVREGQQMVDGIPKAFLRVAEMADWVHPNGGVISAPKEYFSGWRHQFSFWATEGAVFTIGQEGKVNFTQITINDGVLRFRCKSSKHDRDYSEHLPPGDGITGGAPLYGVFVAVYDNLSGYAVRCRVNNELIFDNKYGSAIVPDRIFINGEICSYNEKVFMPRVFCNGKLGNNYYPQVDYDNARVRLALDYGEVWEEWSVENRPPYLGATNPSAFGLVESSSRSPRFTHNANTFSWSWPDGARSVHMWIGRSGGGGKGGRLITDMGYLDDGERGPFKKYKIIQDHLTLHIFEGGEGGAKFRKTEPGLGVDTYVDEIPGATTAEGASYRWITALQHTGWVHGKFEKGAVGMQHGRSPYTLGSGMAGSWRYCEGGRRGYSSSKLSEVTAGHRGAPGLALFHYQY